MIELEEKFFKTFGIEPDVSEVAYFTGNIGLPKITDRHYLELICIINRFDIYFDYYYQEDYEVLKETILDDCINLYYKLEQESFNKLKCQIKKLFKEC